jgi:hypothetical protein
VIEAETCCHPVTLNKINIHNTSCVLTCESLFFTCMWPVSLPFTCFMLWRLYAIDFLSLLWRCGPTRAMALSCLKFLAHTQTHRSRYESSGRVISSSQRPLPDNTQHSQETDIYALGGIRTHSLSRRKGADPSFRPLLHCQPSRTEPSRTEPIRLGKQTYVMKWKHSHCTPNWTGPDRGWPSVFPGWCLFLLAGRRTIL